MSKRNTLQGLRILNTRPLHQGRALSQAIHDAGGISIDFPTLTIEPTSDDWLKHLPTIANIHSAIFISANAVHYFYQALQKSQLKWSASIKNIAIGKASAAALEKYKIHAHHIPAVADSRHLLQLDVLQKINHQTILLVKGEGGLSAISDTLLQREAHLISLAVYRRTLPIVIPQIAHALWHDNAVDIILFTSQQAIHNLFKLLGEDARTWLCNTPCLVISPRLAEEASLLGIQTIINCDYNAILVTLEHYNQRISP